MFTAIGQKRSARPLRRRGARAERTARSSSTASAAPALPGVWAGGDCVLGGEDLTVSAVEDGKAGGALDRRGARRLRRLNLDSEDAMADLRTQFPRHQIAQPVLARLGAADRPQDQRRARVPRRLGRRRLEDAWRGRAAGRQRIGRALWRAPWAGPAPDRVQQHRADHRPRPRDQPARDQGGQARLARSRAGRLADGALRRGVAGRRSSPASKRPNATASS